MLALLLLTLADLGPPRLPAGTERDFAGTAEEVGRSADNPFRKRSELELRLLVLASSADGADVAMLTRVWPLADPVVSGGPPVRGEPRVRLDVLRVDPRGRATGLPPPPLDRLPEVDAGPFVPLPARSLGSGDRWTTPDGDRPHLAWQVGGEADWNGAAAVAVAMSQQSPGFDTPAAAVEGWKRADTLTVLSADGLAVAVDRLTVRREGAAVVGEVRVSYRRTHAGRVVGSRLDEARHEIDAARRFAADLSALGGRPDPRAVRVLLARTSRHLDDRPPNVPFREAVEAVRRAAEGLSR
jgi:hypothetical protein